MLTSIKHSFSFAALALLAATTLPSAHAQTKLPGNFSPKQRELIPVDPAEKFLAPYGLRNFSDHYVEALSALLRGQQEFDQGNHAKTKSILDELWASYPTSSSNWQLLNAQSQPFGINLGSPPMYYGLRMLTDTTNWRITQPGFGEALRTARLTVVLVGESSGIEPQNLSDLFAGTGVFVQHELEDLLLNDQSAVVHQSLKLFREYVVAMTEGELAVETNILHLPDVELDVQTTVTQGGRFVAGLTNAGQVWDFISEEEIEATDWWWLIYPSHVPEQHPEFAASEFITGGMGVGPNSQSPLFIVDDRWLTRKPPHLGAGPYSNVERNVYLPQWLQHEFFHHLYRTYPEFGLETTSHQWFNPSTWPSDFVGVFEPDYYHESLYKRLITASPPLVSALRYATADAPWDALQLSETLGIYQRSPIENPWHIGTIQLAPQLEWQNSANVDWNLQSDITAGKLLTGPDCPYFGTPNGNQFNLILKRNDLGDLLPEIQGFGFNGEPYDRIGP